MRLPGGFECKRLLATVDHYFLCSCDTIISMSSGYYVSRRISNEQCEGERFAADGFPLQCDHTPVFELVHSNGRSLHICEYHIEFYWNACRHSAMQFEASGQSSSHRGRHEC